MAREKLADVVYEGLVVLWIVASPIAISGWVQGMEDPTTWAAFTAGVIGVLVGWLIVAPQQAARARSRPGVEDA